MIPRRIVIHCSASPNERDIDISDIKAWHLAKGFSDVGYHFVLKRDGTVQNGRACNVIGAHVEGANDGALGICLVGNDKFTIEQWEALKKLIDRLCFEYSIPMWEIYGHYEFNSARKQGKTCPNFTIQKLLSWIVFDEKKAIAQNLFE